MRLAQMVFWLSVALTGWLLWDSAGKLPLTVASNFAGNGQAQGFMERHQFLILQSFLIGMMALMFGFMPALLLRMPEGLINMPKKSYWLAPERRQAALAFLGDQLLWMGTATMLFIAYILHLTVAANLNPAPRLDASFIWALVIYLVAVLGWCGWLTLRFNRLPAEST